MSERNQAAIADAIANVQDWKDALFGEPTPLRAFAEIDAPVLLIVGANLPLSSRAVAQNLARVPPNVEVVQLDGLATWVR